MTNVIINKGDALPTRSLSLAIREVFPELDKDGNIEVPCYQTPDSMAAISTLLPKKEDGYSFNSELLSGVLDFLSKPCNDALYIFGPSGSGKTSTVHQAAAYLGWPLVELTLNSRFEMSDLTGHNTIVSGEVQFVYGPLVRAMKYGYILLLNELDLADPGELAGLNDILEGRPLVIVQNNGEVIVPHKNFRLIVTANTSGSGSEENYAGTNLLNSAFLDRFRFLESSYIPFEQEVKLLRERFPGLGAQFSEILVRTADEIRRSHTSQESTAVYMTVPMTTRALIRWAGLCQSCSYKELAEKGAHKALDIAFGYRISREERVYLHRIFDDIRGQVTTGQ